MNRALRTPRETGLGALWNWRGPLMRAAALLSAIIAAYYSTVYGIRLTINEKADRQVVSQIDQRLLVIETILRTDVASRGDLARFRDDVQQRLTRIETLLEPAPRSNR